MTWIGVLPVVSGFSTLGDGGPGRSAEFLAMMVLAVLGMFLLFAASWIARVMAGKRADPVALSRILQLAGMILLFSALAVRPHNPATAAFPPSPDALRSESVTTGGD